MGVTIKKIAELAGVSTGTVDRALYNRGRVNPEVAKRIKDIAKELNYEPNKTARSLHIASKNLKIAVILHTETNLFFEKVLEGIKKASEELSHNGVTVDIFHGHAFIADCQIELLNKAVTESYSAIVIVPIEDKRIKSLISDIKKSIPVFLLTNPLSDADFCEYVGCDYKKAGNLAAGIVNISAKANDKHTAFFSPSFNMLGHTLRYEGFINNDGLKRKGIITDAIEIQRTDKIEIYKTAMDYFSKHKDVNLILANATGLEGGILSALKDSRLIEQVKIIAFDFSEELKEYMKNENIIACIDQGPKNQGYKVMMDAFNSLLDSNAPEKKMSYVNLNILLKESVI